MTEARETRLRRLKMRSWRRGMRETDLILGRFADAMLAGLDAEALDAYEALLDEGDPDILAWITGRAPPDPAHAPMIELILETASISE